MSATRPSATARQARLALGVCLLVITLVLVKIPLLVPLLGGASVDNPVAESLFQALSVPFAAVGALIAARRPRNRVGWLLLIGAEGETRTVPTPSRYPPDLRERRRAGAVQRPADRPDR